jgi:chemotaxis protein MotB
MARKKKEEEAKAAGAPEWMATYSDLVTLLLCFFVLLFAMSSLDTTKFAQLAQSLSSETIVDIVSSSAASDMLLEMMGNGILEFPVPPNSNLPVDAEEEQSNDGEANLDELEDIKASQAAAELSSMESQIETYFADTLAESSPEVSQNGQYISITLAGEVTFDSGSHSLKEEAKEVLKVVYESLAGYVDNTIEIVGYTDNMPISTAKYPDNNILSAYRANSVYNQLAEYGMDVERMRFVGMGEKNPAADNSTPEGRALNRRVEINIYSVLYSGSAN